MDPAATEDGATESSAPDDRTGIGSRAPTDGIDPTEANEGAPDRRWVTRVLDRGWSDHRVGIAASVVVAALWGLVAAWWTPRGPLTTGEVLAAMAIGLLVGATVGLVLGSRWAMLLAPLVFVVVFELARAGADGPTVDGFAFTTYGTFALVVGRGFHGLVGLTPMVLGAVLGAGAARDLRSRWSDAPRRSGARVVVGRVLTAAVAVVVVLLAAVIAQPASTAPITSATGEPVAGSIAELTTVEVDGRDLGIMLRGRNADNPVLLFLAGGPGGSELGAMRNHLEALESSFVVATWDQRGTGTSYPALDPTSTLTLDGAVADTIAVSDHLRERFGRDRIYLLGQSWGTVLGVLAVQAAPDRYTAFIGTGQMVSPLETDRRFYEGTLAWARSAGNTALAEKLSSIGPPPYREMLHYETALAYEHEVYPYDHTGNSEGEGGFSENFLVPEYTLTDKVHLLGSFMDTFAVVYPQLQEIDFRETATDFEIPMFFVQGAHEAPGRADLFDEWFPLVDAPITDRTVLATSGHRPLFERPDEFVAYLEETVLPRTA